MANIYTADNSNELKGRIEEVEKDHIARKQEHELDHSLWRLDDYILEEIKHNSMIKKENFPSFTSNSPYTLSRATMALANKNVPLIRFQLPPDVTEEEEDAANDNERLVYGALYDLDQLRARRDDNNLQYEMTWYIIHRGGVLFRPLFEPEKRFAKFRVAVYDPYECAWDTGEEGLDFFVRRYKMDAQAVEREWGLTNVDTDGSGDADMFEVWWVELGDDPDHPDPDAAPKIYNAVIAGDQWAKEPTLHSEFDHIPVYCVRAGGSPARMPQYAGTKRNWRIDQWESIYTGVRKTIGWMNRAVTLFGLYLRNGAIGPWLYEGSANKNIAKALNPFKIVRIKPGEKFSPVAPPQMAREAKEFLTFVQAEWQKAGVSEVIFGSLPFTVSGFGMIQLRSAVEILIGNYLRATELCYSIIADELTQQFISLGGRRKITVRGKDSREATFLTKLTPRDIKKRYVIEVGLRDALPDDPVAKGNAGNLWRSAGAPRKTIYERILDAPDAGAWDRQYRREKIEELPPVLMLEAVDDLMRAGRVESARLVLRLLIQQGVPVDDIQNAGGLPELQNPSEALPSPEIEPPEVAGRGEREGRFGGGGRPRTRTPGALPGPVGEQ